jgi:hypothetical protein
MEVRRRLLPVLFLGVGAVVYLSLAHQWPTDQHLRLVLGDVSARVEEVTLRCARSEPGSSDDWLREVTFHYAKGGAPRIVSYEPRLTDGDYLVQIETRTDDVRVLTYDRRVRLAGGTTSIDLPQASSLGPVP